MEKIILAAAARLGISVPPLLIAGFVACVIYRMTVKDGDLDDSVVNCAKKIIG